jgi:hypothetical protein
MMTIGAQVMYQSDGSMDFSNASMDFEVSLLFERSVKLSHLPSPDSFPMAQSVSNSNQYFS